MAKTFETFITEERERLQKVREDCLSKRAEIDEQIAAADRELYAINAYEQAKQGKLPTEPRARKPRASGDRAPRGSREALKNQIVALLKRHPEGMVSSQITAAFPDQVKAIPNLLNLMKKDGVLHQEARRGPYSLPE
jgi:hypothetical protein